MKLNKIVYGFLCGICLLTAAPEVIQAEDALFQPFAASGRENTNGVEFGSDAQLGASGSTPGFIIQRDSTGKVQTFHAAPDEHRHYGNWGWLGLLGLMGLLGVRSRSKTDSRYT